MPGLSMSALMAFCPLMAALILVHREDGSAGLTQLLRRSFDFKRIKFRRCFARRLLVMPAVSVGVHGLMRSGPCCWMHFQPGRGHGHRSCDGSNVGTAPAQNLLDVADRKDVKVFREVRAHRKASTLALVERSDLVHRKMRFRRQRRDDSILIGRLLEQSRQGEFLYVTKTLVHPSMTH
jgi:hypothetical protein